MIRSTFCHLPGISTKKEQQIWQNGIFTWDHFLEKKAVKRISEEKKKFFDGKIRQAKKALYSQDSSFFLEKLKPNQMWRLYDFFKEEAVFLDIEASSSTEEGYITVIGLFDGITTKVMVRNINLDEKMLKKELEKYKIIVTFNGSSYDLPMLNKKYEKLLPNIPHIDLRHLCAKVGLRGGLKMIEQELGIRRQNIIVERLYGGDPVQLWRMFLGSGDDYFLNLLVEYNEEDCINLKQIAGIAYQRMKEKVMMQSKMIPVFSGK